MMERDENKKQEFKVIIVGDKCVGKSTLVTRYFRNIFIPADMTVGVCYNSKLWNFEGKDYKMGVWDTAGEEVFRSISQMYYRNADAAILCFDLTRPITREKIDYWIKAVHDVEPLCQTYFCATKCDLVCMSELLASVDFVENIAKEYSIKFYVTSSKTGSDIQNLFQDIFEDYVSNLQLQTRKDDNIIKIQKGHITLERKKMTCCTVNNR